jgi:hypothetical protein
MSEAGARDRSDERARPHFARVDIDEGHVRVDGIDLAPVLAADGVSVTPCCGADTTRVELTVMASEVTIHDHRFGGTEATIKQEEA